MRNVGPSVLCRIRLEGRQTLGLLGLALNKTGNAVDENDAPDTPDLLWRWTPALPRVEWGRRQVSDSGGRDALQTPAADGSFARLLGGI